MPGDGNYFLPLEAIRWAQLKIQHVGLVDLNGLSLFPVFCFFEIDVYFPTKVWPEFHGIPPPLRSEMVLYIVEAG